MTYFYGDKYIANDSLKDGVWVTSDALKNVGMQSGDKIVSIDGEHLGRINEASAKIITAKEIVVDRNGEVKTIALPVNFVDQLMSNKSQGPLVSPRIPVVVSGVEEASPNFETLKKRDFIKQINGQEVKYADEFKSLLENYKGQTVDAVLIRDNKEQHVQLKVDKEGKLNMAFAMGIELDDAERLGLFKLSNDKYGFLESIPVGMQLGVDKLVGYGKQLKMMASPETGAYKGVGGFKAIFDIFPQTWSWEAFWSITAILSIMLGVMNLLPIPALDGGHVMFLLYEIISGRKPSDKFMEYAQTVGFVLLIALLLFANGNDIYKSILGK